MRWEVSRPLNGDTRTVSRFAWTPLTVWRSERLGTRIWLERYLEDQTFVVWNPPFGDGPFRFWSTTTRCCPSARSHYRPAEGS